MKKTSTKQSSRILSIKLLPALLIAFFASVIWAVPSSAVPSSNKDVLAYATNISQSGLLSSTNTQRANNGAGALSLNSLLNSAAQAKAQDMVTRDYWSHQTPDGQQPWVFINNTGYQYQAAGENLAYGFMTSSATVTGWMNSPSHRSNMLDNNFTEVGFGYANSPNYVGSGQQTVVVAMYARPLGASSNSPAPADPAPTSSPVKQSTTASKPAAQAAPTPTETAQPAVEEAPIQEAKPEESEKQQEPIATSTTEQTPPTSGHQEVKKVQLLTGGNAAWSATFVILSICSVGLLWFIHKGIKFGKLLKSGENFIVHHIHFDLTVLAVVYLGFVLLSESGFVR